MDTHAYTHTHKRTCTQAHSHTHTHTHTHTWHVQVEEATNPAKALSKEEFVDDLALTSMARLWDVGKTEPIKVFFY